MKQPTSRDDQLRETESGTLQDGTSDSNKSSHEDCIPSSELVPKVHCAEASDGGAEIERSDGGSLYQGVVGLDGPGSRRYIDLMKLGVDRTIASDAAKEREGESHGEKDGDNNAEVHEPLERLSSLTEKGVHPGNGWREIAKAKIEVR